jgi:hypothetical protein
LAHGVSLDAASERSGRQSLPCYVGRCIKTQGPKSPKRTQTATARSVPRCCAIISHRRICSPCARPSMSALLVTPLIALTWRYEAMREDCCKRRAHRDAGPRSRGEAAPRRQWGTHVKESVEDQFIDCSAVCTQGALNPAANMRSNNAPFSSVVTKQLAL